AHDHDKDYFRQQQIGPEQETYWRACCAFDCGCSYFTATEIPDHDGEIPEDAWKESQLVTTYIPSSVGSIRFKMRKVEEFRIDVSFSSVYN
ncbi:hypothetical protein PMAYCL1PPCAC_31288, partial [Pristionchus mayeri]